MPSRSAVMAVLAVVVLLAVVFGVRVWLASGGDGASLPAPAGVRAEPTGVSRGTSTLSRASPSGSGAASDGGVGAGAAGGAASANPGAGAGAVVVHVVGQVATPGVYRMAAGARVGDAVAAAGGAARTADLTAVNLARVLVDGEQIVVPKPGEVVAGPGPGGQTSAAGTGSASGGVGGGAGVVGAAGAKVSLNSADLSALDTLPGVGPVLAQRILDWRTEHGRFTSVEELGEVSGIGEKLLAQLTPKVTL